MKFNGRKNDSLNEIIIPDWAPKITSKKKLDRKITNGDILKVMLEFNIDYGKFLKGHFINGAKV